MVTWEQLVYGLEAIIIILMVYSVREKIIKEMYGIRFKRWVEIDTGRMGYTILNKSLNSCKILNQIRTVNRENIKSNIMYFVSDNVENLKLEDDKSKYLAYCNSDEFGTVYYNKLIETLMLTLKNKELMLILIFSVAAAAMIGYSIYIGQQDTAKIDWLVWKVNSTYAP